jgi:hypothetical protein
MAANDPLNLDEEGEWAGLWWLADNPDDQVPGVLRYDAEGDLSLALIGAFEDRFVSTPAPGLTVYHEGTRTWGVIHGAAEQREITLLGCIAVASKRTLFARVDSPDKQTVKAMKAIIGAHVSGEDDKAFAVAEVSVEDLGLWSASSVLEGFIGAPDGRIDGTGCISVKPTEAKSVMVDRTEYVLAHTHTSPLFDQRTGGTVGRVRDTALFRVTPAEPFSLGVALGAARLVQDLIALAMHRPAGVIWLRLTMAGTQSMLPSGQPLPRRHAYVLYSPAARGKHDAKSADEGRALFTCASLPFEEVVPRWCEAHGRLQAAINMILGMSYAPARFIESNLLTAVGAAEVLHRGLHIDEKPIPMEEFGAMRDAMLLQVPQAHRDRFKRAIRNDPTLQDRLRALAARPDQEAIALLVPDVACWARSTTRARNDLAHEGTTRNHSLEELVAVIEVTKAVVILNLLHELGVPLSRQRELVQSHPELREASRKAGDWLVATQSDA